MEDESPGDSLEHSAPGTNTPTEPGIPPVISPASSGGDSAESVQQTQSPAQSSSASFEFILGKDGDSRKRARSHVMRDFMRKKRSRGSEASNRARSASANVPGGAGPSRSLESGFMIPEDLPVRTRDYHQTERDQLLADRFHAPVGLARSTSLETSSNVPVQSQLRRPILQSSRSDHLTNVATLTNETSTGALVAARPPAPQMGIGAETHIDPFNSLSYPMVLSTADHELLHHYTSTMPAMMFQAVNLDLLNQWQNDFQTLGHSNALVLQSLLAFSASHLAALHGRERTIQSITHNSRLIRMLNNTLQRGLPGDQLGALYAMQQLAAIENRWGNLDVSPLHYTMIRQIVQVHGGMKVVRSQHSVEIAIYETDSLLLSHATTGPGLPWESNPSRSLLPPSSTSGDFLLGSSTTSTSTPGAWHAPNYTPTPPNLTDTEDIRLACEQFIDFLKSVSTTTSQLRHSYTSISLQFSTWQTPSTVRRIDTFAPGSALHRLLSSTSSFGRQGVGRSHTQEFCIMFALLYLNSVILAFRDDPSGLDSFLVQLRSTVFSNELDRNHSIETLVMIMFNESDRLSFEAMGEDQGWTVWFAGRMLRVTKRLGADSWRWVKARLLTGLVVVGEDEGGERDEEELRREILGNLYVWRLLLR